MVVELGDTPGPVQAGVRAARRVVPGLGPSFGPGLAMLVVGLIGVTGPGIGWDEAATADMATRSVAQILGTIPNVDAVFGSYYLFMHFWTGAFGLSELALRAPSVIAMAVAVGLTGELGRRLVNPVVGTLAGLFLCAMPATTRYAQEARPYAICCMFATLATLLLYRNLENPARGRWAWLGYGITVLLLGASHLIALTVLGAHAVIVLRHRAGRPLLPWLTAAGAALVCLAPIAYLGVGQREGQVGWVEPLTVRTLLGAPASIILATGTAWLLVGMALLATWRWVELAALVLVPVAAVAGFSVLVEPIWVPRYLLFVLMPLALLSAAGAAGAAGAVGFGGRAGLTRLLAVLAVVAATAYYDQRTVRGVTAHYGGNYQQAAEAIRRLDRPGDAIVFQSGRTMRTGIGYYLRDEPDRPADVLLHRTAAARARLSAGEYADPAPYLRDRRRVWLVVMGRPADPITQRPTLRPVLQAGFTRTGMWQFSRTTLALYTRAG
jgi:mannosyltransferase